MLHNFTTATKWTFLKQEKSWYRQYVRATEKKKRLVWDRSTLSSLIQLFPKQSHFTFQVIVIQKTKNDIQSRKVARIRLRNVKGIQYLHSILNSPKETLKKVHTD